MGKLRVSVGQTRQLQPYEPTRYDISYEADLEGLNLDEIEKLATTWRNRLKTIISGWFVDDSKMPEDWEDAVKEMQEAIDD